jgi:hypothetical protein
MCLCSDDRVGSDSLLYIFTFEFTHTIATTSANFRKREVPDNLGAFVDRWSGNITREMHHKTTDRSHVLTNDRVLGQ